MTSPVLTCEVTTESWPLVEPVRIARATYTAMDTVTVELRDGRGNLGRGEAMGLPYEGESVHTMVDAIDRVKSQLAGHIQAEDLRLLMPRGGARNAVDAALWDLRAKQAGRRVWDLLGMAAPAAVCTAYTLGIDDETPYRRRLRAARQMPILKLKVNRHHHLDMVRWARQEHPDARLLLDANQSWDRPLLDELVTELEAMGVELIEQPVARGEDRSLAGYAGAIPLAADESCTDAASLEGLLGLYSLVNIKLDKCGGLTEALRTSQTAHELGFRVMVGNMGGTSLSMAPALLVAQGCQFADLDAPLLCRSDRSAAMQYIGPHIQVPEPALWG